MFSLFLIVVLVEIPGELVLRLVGHVDNRGVLRDADLVPRVAVVLDQIRDAFLGVNAGYLPGKPSAPRRFRWFARS